MKHSPLELAARYINAGLSVMPTNQKKRPTVEWGPLTKRKTTMEEAKHWFPEEPIDNFGIGVICGAVSGGLEVIDVDTKYALDPKDFEASLLEAINEYDASLLQSMLIVRTRTGGFHLYYRCGTIDGNKKLASRATTADERFIFPKETQKVLIETRGEGGYVCAFGTAGYSVEQGTYSNIPIISGDQRNDLLEVCRSFNECFEESKVITNLGNYKTENAFTKFNREGDILPVLEANGWTRVYSRDERVFLKRPGISDSVTSGNYHTGLKKFYVWSSSTDFEPNRAYTNSDIFIVLEAMKDTKLAYKKLCELGFGEIKQQDKEGEEKKQGSLESIIITLKSNYSIKYNLMTDTIHVDGRPVSDEKVNDIFIDFEIKHKQKVNINTLKLIFKSKDYFETFHPILDFFAEFDAMPWDQVDRLTPLAKSIRSGSQEFSIVYDYLKRWLVGVVAQVHGVTNPLMLILVGRQGSGKTHFIKNLLPDELRAFFATAEIMDKGHFYNTAGGNIIVFDDEFAGKNRAEAKEVKRILSLDVMSVTRKYEAFEKKIVRIASFCGSCNENDVISDHTGNRRFLPVETGDVMDWELYNSIDKKQLLAQCYFLFREGFSHEILGDAILIHEENTLKFNYISKEQEMIATYFQKADGPNDSGATWMTATDIIAKIETIINKPSGMYYGLVGKAMKIMGHISARKRLGRNNPVMAYFIVYKMSDLERSEENPPF